MKVNVSSGLLLACCGILGLLLLMFWYLSLTISLGVTLLSLRATRRPASELSEDELYSLRTAAILGILGICLSLFVAYISAPH